MAAQVHACNTINGDAPKKPNAAVAIIIMAIFAALWLGTSLLCMIIR